jgi:hypothetical protein
MGTKRTFSVLVVLAVLAALFSGSPASATDGDWRWATTTVRFGDGDVGVQSGPSYRGCPKDSFTGEVRFWYLYNGSYVYYVGRVDYRIQPGNNRNHANIIWRDANGVIFGIDSADNGVQDGAWHLLPGNTNGYNRNRFGDVSVEFIFDKATPPGVPDPRCTKHTGTCRF